MADVVPFAIGTCMRAGEIARALWADVDRAAQLLLIRDRKDPRRKKGNDQHIPLLPAAWAVLERRRLELERAGQPLEGEIFPLAASTLSKYFTDACSALSIPDLHLHDLRHEGTSRLFEQGYTIEQVALVTGHKSWTHLKRYTQLRPVDLHRRPQAKG
jgi:integrase